MDANTLWTVIVVSILGTTVYSLDCSDGYFGDECSGICHCGAEAEVCDKSTGYCTSGCAASWTGPGCQTHVNEEDSAPVSVLGVAIGVAVFVLLATLSGIFYCLSMVKKSRARRRQQRIEGRQQRANRIHQYLHNSNTPLPRRDRRSPFRIIPLAQKLNNRFLPYTCEHQGRLPSYPGVADCMTSVPAVHDSHRSETPPPSYEESMITGYASRDPIGRRYSRDPLISELHPNNIWTIT